MRSTDTLVGPSATEAEFGFPAKNENRIRFHPSRLPLAEQTFCFV